jgi:hypothetical protein
MNAVLWHPFYLRLSPAMLYISPVCVFGKGRTGGNRYAFRAGPERDR